MIEKHKIIKIKKNIKGFLNSEKIKLPKNLEYIDYKDDIECENGDTINRFFRWRYNDSNEWSELLFNNEQNLSKISNLDKEVFIRWIWYYEGTNLPFVNDVILDYGYTILNDNQNNNILPVDYDRSAAENLSEMIKDLSSSAGDIESTLNDVITFSSPIEVLYFRTEPYKSNIDVMLREYSAHKTVEEYGKCLKIVVKDNDIPIVHSEMDEFGIQFEKIEVYVPKENFERIFGDNTEPRDEDFLYEPLSNRLFTVSNVYKEYVTGYNKYYYVMNLVKYDDVKSVDKSDEIEDFLLDKMITPETAFGDDIAKEIEAVHNENLESKISNISDDDIRKYVSGDMLINEDCIKSGGDVVARAYYDLTNINCNDDAVIYVNTIDDTSFTISQWINHSKKLKPVVVNINGDYVNIDDNKCEYRFITDGYTETIILSSDTQNGQKILRGTPMQNKVYYGISPVNIITISNDNDEYGVYYVPGYFVVISNDKLISMVSCDISENEFKNVSISFDKNNDIITFNVFGLSGDRSSSRLIRLFHQMIKPSCSIKEIHGELKLLPSPSKIANIKIVKGVVPDEEMNLFAATTIIKSIENVIIHDECQPVYNYGRAGSGNRF